MTFPTFSLNKTPKFGFSKILNFLLILNILVLVAMYVVAYFPQFFRYKDRILESTFPVIICLIGIFLLRVLHYIFYKSKKKTEIGSMELMLDKIILNQKEIPVSNIQHLRFVGNDILGDFRGFSSKGTENQIFIKLNSSKETSSYFLQTKENNLKSKKQVLEKYYELGILSEANLENILNNTNYY